MIYLVRHGQTDWNLVHKIQGHLDTPLNETGRNEAMLCAKRLASVKIDEIFSSDLSRAKETASIINQSFSCPIRFDSRLREVNFGDLQGTLVKDMTPEKWDTFNHDPHKVHAESLEDVYKRVKFFLDEMDKNRNTLLVTHGGVIRMVMYYALNSRLFNQDEFEKNFLKFKIKNTEIFVWDGIHPFQQLS